MTFTLESVVPWGRSYDEYCAMFALSERHLGQRLLGCGDGPAGFNCALTRNGGQIISADPLYRFSAAEIRQRIDATHTEIMRQTEMNQHEFVWVDIPSIQALSGLRMSAMRDFLADYEAGRAAGRYVDAELPALPFTGRQFDLALCSHFLFLYSEQLSEDFHVQSIRELCRVAEEARIFPLLELGAKKSRHVDAVIRRLERDGYKARVEKVPYEFQKGGDQMLRVSFKPPLAQRLG